MPGKLSIPEKSVLNKTNQQKDSNNETGITFNNRCFYGNTNLFANSN